MNSPRPDADTRAVEQPGGPSRAGFLAVPVLAVVGAVSAAWSLFLIDEHSSPAPDMGSPWGDDGCSRIAVPLVQYWTGYGSVVALVLALYLYRRFSRTARRRGLDPMTRWDGLLSAFGAVIALCFGLLALFAAFAVTVQGLAIEGEADFVCLT